MLKTFEPSVNTTVTLELFVTVTTVDQYELKMIESVPLTWNPSGIVKEAELSSNVNGTENKTSKEAGVAVSALYPK
jgi:hypothetical protein